MRRTSISSLKKIQLEPWKTTIRMISQSIGKKIKNGFTMVRLQWKFLDFILNKRKNYCIKIDFSRLSLNIYFLFVKFINHNFYCGYNFIFIFFHNFQIDFIFSHLDKDIFQPIYQHKRIKKGKRQVYKE